MGTHHSEDIDPRNVNLQPERRMARLYTFILLAALVAVAVAASANRKELDEESSALIKRLLDLYKKKEALKKKEAMEAEKRRLEAREEEVYLEARELMTAYIDKRNTGFMMLNGDGQKTVGMIFNINDNGKTFEVYRGAIMELFRTVNETVNSYKGGLESLEIPNPINVWTSQEEISIKYNDDRKTFQIFLMALNLQIKTVDDVTSNVPDYKEYAVFSVKGGDVADHAMKSSVTNDGEVRALHAIASKCVEAADEISQRTAGNNDVTAKAMVWESERFNVYYYRDLEYIAVLYRPKRV